MKLRHILVAALFSSVAVAPLGAQASSFPVPSINYIQFGGQDWAWASPCNFDCSSVVLGDGFRFATAAEWAAKPAASDFLDAVNGVSYFGGPAMRCASAWFDIQYTHCDYGDGDAGLLASGPGIGDPPGDLSETWLVRDRVVATPEPASIALLATGLVGIAGFVRRRKA